MENVSLLSSPKTVRISMKLNGLSKKKKNPVLKHNFYLVRISLKIMVFMWISVLYCWYSKSTLSLYSEEDD